MTPEAVAVGLALIGLWLAFRAPRKHRRRGRVGTIYYIGDGDGHVKIGYTGGRAEDRMRALQTGTPARLRLLATQPGTMQEERALHRRFGHARVRRDGEWFRMTPGLRRQIAGHRPIPWRLIVVGACGLAVAVWSSIDTGILGP